MKRLITSFVLLAALAALGGAQEKAKPKADYDVRRCTPKLVSEAGEKSKSPDEFHFRKGEVYRNTPVVTLEILESGEVVHAVLKRKSGVAEIDAYALKWVQGMKYNQRPGCGAIETQVDVTIDFR